MNPTDQRIWLTTGCSSGFGRALSAALHAGGVRQVATARDPAALTHLPDHDELVVKARLDVVDRITVEQAFEAGVAAYGRIDVVVNNAGVGVIGPVEDVTDAQVREQFEVNVFGILNVVRVATPLFRDRRSGLFVNFASMAGEVSIDSLGIYSASKFAVEGLSEALRAELSPFGVDVMIVEPGPFDTEWLGRNAVWGPRDEDRYPEVWKYVEGMKTVYADRAQVGDPAKAAAAIVEAARRTPPPPRLPLGAMAFDAIERKVDALRATLDAQRPAAPSMLYAGDRL